MRLPLVHSHRLGDQIRQAGDRRPQQRLTELYVVVVVVVGEDVLVPPGDLVVGHRPRTGPRAVELGGGLLGGGPQAGKVRCLVEPGAPDDDRRPAPVPGHHVAHVLHDQVLPARGGTHVVPARCLFPDQQPELIAGVEEVRRLRVVRAADHVAVEFLLQDLRVRALNPAGHRHASVRVELVPVQAEQLQPLAVQVEAVGLERRVPEPDPPGQDVAAHAGEGQRGLHGVQLGVVRRPQGDIPESGQAQLPGGDAGRVQADRCGLGGDQSASVEQLDHQAAVGMRWQRRVDTALHVYPPLRGEHVDRQGEQVGQERLREHPQPDVAVDPARLEEVDSDRAVAQAHRRHRQAVGVHQDREQVVARGDVAGEFGRERQVPALVGADRVVVDHYRRVDHDPVEIDHDPVARPTRSEQWPAVEMAPVDPHLLPLAGVPITPRKRSDRVRHRDQREAAVVVERTLRARHVLPAEQPVRVQREVQVGGLRLVRPRHPPDQGQHPQRGDPGPANQASLDQCAPRDPPLGLGLSLALVRHRVLSPRDLSRGDCGLRRSRAAQRGLCESRAGQRGFRAGRNGLCGGWAGRDGLCGGWAGRDGLCGGWAAQDGFRAGRDGLYGSQVGRRGLCGSRAGRRGPRLPAPRLSGLCLPSPRLPSPRLPGPRLRGLRLPRPLSGRPA